MFGIACLLLANKITDEVQIQIDHSIFPKKEIFIWQQKICTVLKFKLNPITGETVLIWIVNTWNKFAEKYSLWAYNLYCLDSEKLTYIRKMF